jgi:hypothetical protein
LWQSALFLSARHFLTLFPHLIIYLSCSRQRTLKHPSQPSALNPVADAEEKLKIKDFQIDIHLPAGVSIFLGVR